MLHIRAIGYFTPFESTKISISRAKFSSRHRGHRTGAALCETAVSRSVLAHTREGTNSQLKRSCLVGGDARRLSPYHRRAAERNAERNEAPARGRKRNGLRLSIRGPSRLPPSLPTIGSANRCWHSFQRRPEIGTTHSQPVRPGPSAAVACASPYLARRCCWTLLDHMGRSSWAVSFR